MKKILFVAFCLISLASIAQTKWIPFYGNVKVNGLFNLTEVTTLPANPGMITLANYHDTLFIYDMHGWIPLMGISGDTIKFTDGSYVTSQTGSMKLSASGSNLTITLGSSHMMQIVNGPSGMGEAINELNGLRFTNIEVGTRQRYMQGFYNDTIYSERDSAITMSAKSIKQYVLAHGADGGAIENTDSTTRTDKQISGNPYASVKAFRSSGNSNIYLNTIAPNEDFQASINVVAPDAGPSRIELIADDVSISGGNASVDGSLTVTDSIYAGYIAGGPDPMFVVVTPGGGLDSGWLDPLYRGLVDPLWDVNEILADTQNKEIAWFHINDSGVLVKTYGLPGGMDNFEALQYTSEQSLRLIAKLENKNTELENRIIELEKHSKTQSILLLILVVYCGISFIALAYKTIKNFGK